MSARHAERKASPFFEIARVLVRFDDIASFYRKREPQHVVGEGLSQGPESSRGIADPAPPSLLADFVLTFGLLRSFS
jgi:hypothetical protein